MHDVNCNGSFDRQNGCRIHSLHKTVRHHQHSDKCKCAFTKVYAVKFNIIPVVTGTLMGRMGAEPILPVTVYTVINF